MEMIKLTDWFNPNNVSHIREYRYLQQSGSWREGFIPPNVLFSSIWQVELMAMMTDVYVQKMLQGKVDP